MNPDTIGCVWTGEFDLNTLRVDWEILKSGKKKLRIQKDPDTCARGLNLISFWLIEIPSILYVRTAVLNKITYAVSFQLQNFRRV